MGSKLTGPASIELISGTTAGTPGKNQENLAILHFS